MSTLKSVVVMMMLTTTPQNVLDPLTTNNSHPSRDADVHVYMTKLDAKWIHARVHYK